MEWINWAEKLKGLRAIPRKIELSETAESYLCPIINISLHVYFI